MSDETWRPQVSEVKPCHHKGILPERWQPLTQNQKKSQIVIYEMSRVLLIEFHPFYNIYYVKIGISKTVNPFGILTPLGYLIKDYR